MPTKLARIMRITIESIDLRSEFGTGGGPVTSARVGFLTRGFGGSARFVPASASNADLLGREFDVEIDHERISDLSTGWDEGLTAGVSPLAEPGSFRVRGVVIAVVALGAPDMESLVTVAAGDAIFALDQQDVGDAAFAKGACLTFTAHEVSLWDEAS